MTKKEFKYKSNQLLITKIESERLELSQELMSFIREFNLIEYDLAFATKKINKEKIDFSNFITNPNYYRNVLATLLEGTAQKL